MAALTVLNELIFKFEVNCDKWKSIQNDKFKNNTDTNHPDHLTLTKKQKQLIVSGYIRQNKLSSIKSIQQIISDYFDEVFYIKLAGNKLKEFLDDENYDSFHEVYTIRYVKYISIHCELFLLIDDGNGLIRFLLIAVPIFDESFISDIGYVIDLRCKQLNVQWKGRNDTKYSTPEDDMLEGMDEYTKIINKDVNQLTFNVYIDIDLINYKNNTSWIKPLPLKTMNKSTSFTWNIDTNILRKQCGVYINIFSDLSDDKCWFLELTHENVNKQDGAHDVNLYIHCHRIPYGVYEIVCDNVILVKDDNNTILYQDDFSFYVNREKNCLYRMIGKNNDLFRSKLTIFVKIDLIKIETDQGQFFNFTEKAFSQYNIL